MNERDPLLKSGPDQQRELFTRFTQAANGFSIEDVLAAACWMIVNALRQSYAKREDAERSFDEWFGKMKSILVGHYDSTGRKNGIFPFHQVIAMPLFRANNRLKH